MIKFLPSSDRGGVTTAVNDTVTSPAAEVVLPSGAFFMISVGAQPIFIRFGQIGVTAVSSSNGLRIAANTTLVLSRPEEANVISHIRDGGTDSTISIQGGIADT